jgi:predicted amidohydrolase
VTRLATDLAVAGAAAGLLALSGLQGGPWWSALAAGGLLWPRLVRASWPRGAIVAAIALLPVPMIGYEGLRAYDPPAWWAVSAAVAAGYGAIGGVAAGLAGRAWRAAPLAWRPLPWIAAWSGLDLLVTHAQPWPLPFPVTVGYALVGGPLVALAALAGPAGLGVVWGVLGVARPVSGAAPSASPAPAPGGRPPPSRCWPPRACRRRPARPRRGRRAPSPCCRSPTGRRSCTSGSPPSGRAAAALRADLHVWPEAALAREVADDPAPLIAVARALDAPVLAGAFRRTHDGGWRNAAVLADLHQALFAVDKRWLVPGYEDWLTPGIGERWPLRAAGWRLGVLICWESLFLDEAIDRARRGADVLVVLAHDGWANGTGTPWWHARAGRLVAWSAGRPVVVASHDGPSMVWATTEGSWRWRSPGRPSWWRGSRRRSGWRTPYVWLGSAGLAAVWVAVVRGRGSAAAWRARAMAPRHGAPRAHLLGWVRGAARRAPTRRRSRGCGGRACCSQRLAVAGAAQHAAGALEDRLRRRRCPTRWWAEAGVEVGAAVGDQARLQRAAAPQHLDVPVGREPLQPGERAWAGVLPAAKTRRRRPSGAATRTGCHGPVARAAPGAAAGRAA